MATVDEIPLNALPDVVDFRDRHYEPALIQLQPSLDPPSDLVILNQGREGACTGFGLAAVINKLNSDRRSDVRVSPRMLYEMAKKFDCWPGERYSGSSCRGAIKGWHCMGVCREALWPHKGRGGDRQLTVERAKDARNNTIGAYYRVRKNIVDMHAALNEAGAVYVSAQVHKGWFLSAVKQGVIKYPAKTAGGHAFAIVGYNERGFWVQNSWGTGWGKNGLALWTYEDWKENITDAWVLRLAVPTPQIWSGRHQESPTSSGKSGLSFRGPRRDEIAGHFVHVDDGKFHNEGKYWSTLEDVKLTANHIAGNDKYEHVLFYAHGGLNSATDSATRIAAMKETFKANGIYPFHFMYDTVLLKELEDVIVRKKPRTEATVGVYNEWSDQWIESVTRRSGRALWREMKSDAELSFRAASRPGRQTLIAFLNALHTPGAKPKKIHLVGHSTGAILLAHLLQALVKMKTRRRLLSVSLLAPAVTVKLYESHYLPLLKTHAGAFGIDTLHVYNLDEQHELDDHVAHVYRKSLLYLVSNAFEEEREARLLGIQTFSKDVAAQQRMQVIYSSGNRSGATRSQSTSHGDFDNDPATMNDVLKTVLGKKPIRAFDKKSLDY